MSGNEENSMKEAGGCAPGFTGRIFNLNTDAAPKLAAALMDVGKYVQGESGCLLGHIKAAVYVEDGKGITLNLIDMDNGVEHHGTMDRADEVKFNFMCAVLDVDEYDLTHKMLHAIDDSGLDYFIDKESLEGHHHDHHHVHEDGKECDDPECSCHHHHHDDEECDDPNCSCHHHQSLASMIDENGHFSHHHHDHDHEHHHHDGECCCGHHHEHEPEEECHCHDHDHEHHHEHGEECHCHEHKEKEPEKKEKKGFFSFLKRKK